MNVSQVSRRTRWAALARWTLRFVLLALAGVVVAALVVLVVSPAPLTGSAMTVLTGSMTPTIPVGSVVMVRPVDPATSTSVT